MKIPWFKEKYDENFVINKIKKYNMFSVGEIIVINNENLFKCDLFNGIYTNKLYNSFSIYLIYSIEYIDYDKKLYQNSYFSKKEIRLNENNENYIINSFKIFENYESISINFIPYDYNIFFQLPKNLLKTIFGNINSFIPFIYEKEYKLFIDELNKGKNIFVICGKKKNGITNIFRKYSDENGYSFFKKIGKNFETKNNLLNYLKKKEFMSPCLIYFKNLNNEFLEEYFFEQIETIFNMSRIPNKNNIYILFYENKFEIPNFLLNKYKVLYFHNISLDEKQKLIIDSLLFFKNHYQNLLQSSFIKKISEKIKNKKIINLNKEILNNESISKILINLPLKDIKSSLLNIYYQYFLNSNNEILPILKNELTRIYNNYLNNPDNEKISISSIPKISWSDIGGLSEIKNEIDSILNPKINFNNIKKPNGILLYGPPGTGKTLIAKAIANTTSMNFINIKGPELLNMYIGENENNIKKNF